jgi:hypothetical protein
MSMVTVQPGGTSGIVNPSTLDNLEAGESILFKNSLSADTVTFKFTDPALFGGKIDVELGPGNTSRQVTTLNSGSPGGQQYNYTVYNHSTEQNLDAVPIIIIYPNPS